MSLLVWLPLMGNLENQGLSDSIFSIYNGDTYIISSSNGKIGSCYERTAANSGAGSIRSSGKYTLSGDISMACWAYIETATTSANGLVTAHSHANNTGVGITVKYVSDTDYRISCNTGNGTSRTYNTYYGTTNIKGAWHHLALTYSSANRQLLLYVDGKLDYTLNDYTNASQEDYIDIFSWSTSYVNANYKPKCKLNDVRIYDECLSQKEIYEISKAKILHYSLNEYDGIIGGKNLIKNANNIALTGSDYSSNSQRVLGKVTVISDATGNAYTWVQNNLSIPALTLNAIDQTLTYSVDIKTTNLKSDATITFGFRNTEDHNNRVVSTVNILKDNDGSWIRYSAPLEITASTTRGRALMSITFPAGNNGAIIEYRNPKLEIGDATNTFWSPAPEDEAECSFIDDNVIYDNSGYGHNGTIMGNLSWDPDSKIGNGSYRFDADASKCIHTPGLEQADEFTWACWLKMKAKTSGHQFILSEGRDYEKYGLNITINSAGVLRVFYGTSGTIITSATLTPEVWYHVALTVSSTNGIKLYLNGELNQSATYITPDYSYNSDRFVIGKMAYNYTNTSNYFPFNGSINDIRIYATALNAEDIQDLYKTRYEFSNNNSFFCDNLIEIETSTSKNLLQEYLRTGGRTLKIDENCVIIGTDVADTYFYLKTQEALTVDEVYTLSCDAFNVPDGLNWTFGIKSQSSGMNFPIRKNGRNYYTFTLKESIAANTEFILDDVSGRPSVASNIILSNFKLIKGESEISSPSFCQNGVLEVEEIAETILSSIEIYEDTIIVNELIEE